MELPIDIEDALQAALNARGYHACAPPLPEDFETATLPLTYISIVGGVRTSLVRDAWRVNFDTYAETAAVDALDASRVVMAEIATLQGEMLGGVACYSVQPLDLPHESLDSEHPNLYRATFWAEVACRCLHR